MAPLTCMQPLKRLWLSLDEGNWTGKKEFHYFQPKRGGGERTLLITTKTTHTATMNAPVPMLCVSTNDTLRWHRCCARVRAMHSWCHLTSPTQPRCTEATMNALGLSLGAPRLCSNMDVKRGHAKRSQVAPRHVCRHSNSYG